MGKGSEVLERLTARTLTAQEREARRAVVENGGDVEAMPDGRLVKIEEETEQPRPAGRGALEIWD